MKSQNIFKTELHLNHISGQLHLCGIDCWNTAALLDVTTETSTQDTETTK